MLAQLFISAEPLPPAARIVLAVWLAALGGCIGSFMNVVVYRLPRGRSLVHPGSACPRCGHAIRWMHNVPVFGWLLLRGRCYDCRAAIPARYPLVEAIVTALFLIVAWVGPLSEGLGVPRAGEGALSLLWERYIWQMLLLCDLLCLALIEYDGDPRGETRFPKLLFFGPLLVGVIGLAVWPDLHPVPISPSLLETMANRPWLSGLSSAAAGSLVGLTLGLLAWPALDRGPLGKRGRRYALSAAVLVGLYLGWQAVTALVLATAVVNLATARLTRWPWSLVLFCLTLLWLVFWRPLYEQIPILGAAPGEDLTRALLLACAATWVCAWATRRLTPST